MGFDLTNERIQDTYEQLVQISGSKLVDGTGSLIIPDITTVSASYAETASFALNAGANEWDDILNKPSGLVSSSAQTIANLPSGILSSSAQIADDISGSFTSTSASIASDVATNKSDISTLTGETSSYAKTDENVVLSNPNGNQTFSIEDPLGGDAITFRGAPDFITTFETQQLDMASSNIVGIENLSGSWGEIKPDGANRLLIQSKRGDGVTRFSNQNGSTLDLYKHNVGFTTGYAQFFVPVTASQALVSGDLVVNGTASFGYLQSVTGSAKIVGDAFIQVNTDTPALRYAGLQVVDSGSTANTASFIWDSQNNDFFYEYEGDDTDYGVFMVGPEYSTKGSPTYLTNNTIPKGDGGHHLNDSIITDDGSEVAIGGDLDLNGNLTFTDGEVRIGRNSVVSSGSYDAIGIGDDVSVTGFGGIAIGGNAISDGSSGTALGRYAKAGSQVVVVGAFSSGSAFGAVVVGNNTAASGDYSVGIGYNLTTDPSDTHEVNINDVVKYSGDTNESISIGNGADASGQTQAIAIGKGASAGAENAISLGDGPSAGGTDSIVIGRDGAADFTEAIAIGRGTTSQANNAIGIGAGLSLSSNNEINIGDKFKYDGTSTITLDGSLIKVADSASATGSLIDNVHPAIASGSTAIQHIVTIDQTAYDTISGSGNVNDDTFYIISDAGDDVYPNNLQVAGQIFSPTHAGSVASSTSSIDFNEGNFATLTLSSATFLANPSNLKSGTTYTIIFEESGSHVSGYGDAFLFADGTEPTLSDGKDVLTMVSDGTNLFATALTNFS